MRRALYAEFTKLRTAPGVGWLLPAIVASTVALSWVAASATHCGSAGCDVDLVKRSLTGVQSSQILVAALAISVVGGEYASGMIHGTLTAVPRRLTVLAAKAVVVAAATLAAGLVAAPAALLVGRAVLADKGYHFPVTAAATQRALFGSVGYLVLIGLFGLGIAFVARSPTGAIGAVLGLLFAFPLVIRFVNDLDLVEALYRISPMNAGLTVQNTTGLADLPITPVAGLGVLAAWAAASLLAGGLSLRLRDA